MIRSISSCRNGNGTSGSSVYTRNGILGDTPDTADPLPLVVVAATSKSCGSDLGRFAIHTTREREDRVQAKQRVKFARRESLGWYVRSDRCGYVVDAIRAAARELAPARAPS